MYLISIYFDEKTDKRIRSYMTQIAKHTENTAMIQGEVPPHLTISAFGADSEEEAREIFYKVSRNVKPGNLQWAAVGAFLPQVIYLSPVLNEYLQNVSEITYKEVVSSKNVSLKGNYRPYGWMPHTTLAKHLTKEQMTKAFEVLQGQFGPFEGCVTKIGLARTNPYKDIELLEFKKIKKGVDKTKCL